MGRFTFCLKIGGMTLGRALHGEKPANDILRLIAEGILSRGGIGKGQSRQKMSGGMSPEESRGFLPSPWRQCVFGVKAKGPTKIVEHSVSVKEPQIFETAVLVFRKDPDPGKVDPAWRNLRGFWTGDRLLKGCGRKIRLPGKRVGKAGQYSERKILCSSCLFAGCRESESYPCGFLAVIRSMNMAPGINAGRIVTLP